MTEQAETKNQLIWPGMKIHLVGIGGYGLSAIAQLLLGQGYKVSGSDQHLNDRTEALKTDGATIFGNHSSSHLNGVDLVLISSAIPEDNQEIREAKRKGIPIVKRAEFLEILTGEKTTIAVAGSHGKTTTTGMITQIMLAAGLDPSFIIGGILANHGSNGHAGQDDYFVIEADEYDYMFLGLRPQIAVITNIDYDHPDLFASRDDYHYAFKQFTEQIEGDGTLFACSDDDGAHTLMSNVEGAGVNVISYGVHSGSWQAKDLRTNPMGGTDFLALFQDEVIGLARIRLPGEHNVSNSLAAIAVTQNLDISFNVIRQALSEFGGIGRRFQIVGDVADVVIVDDYAHHPTEIRATLAAAKQRFPGRRLWAVWQPHTFSRIKSLLVDFAECFGDADRVVGLDVYGSRESNNQGVDISQVLESIVGPRTNYLPRVDEAATFILDRIKPGDVIVILTAGDGNLVGKIITDKLERRIKTNGSK